MYTFNRRYLVFLVCLSVGLLIAYALLEAPGDKRSNNIYSSSRSVRKTVLRNGYDIEIFDSAEAQWRYARACYFDPKKKQAALEVLVEFYPTAKLIRAEAELELAYMTLGADYRFANRIACLSAIEKYRRITDEFSELPAVEAKAHWYMGWIYADLLGQKSRALAHYQTIVSHYPNAAFKLESPVPWLTLVLPQPPEERQRIYEHSVYSWRSIALLEIIRNTKDEKAQWTALKMLWSDDRNGPATGPALKHLLRESHTLRQKASAITRSALEARLFSPPIAKEIHHALYLPEPCSGQASRQRLQ